MTPLDDYRRKRDFSKTPEPSGEAAKRRPRSRTAKTTLYFCVQKHLASRLHYDLRLEHNGVLLSWAVPKGPSLDPTHKRMAVQTEDHPTDYGDFEGVIPEGYGAGIVMLWDYGTWQPQSADIDAALDRGDLKFTLDGYKLKGSWVLVRTRDRAGTSPKQPGRSWLLIKHRDFWSGPIDITGFAPLSVKSESNFDDILADDMPDVWLTGRPATGRGPSKQMVATIEKATRIILARGSTAKKALKTRARKMGGSPRGRPPATSTRRR